MKNLFTKILKIALCIIAVAAIALTVYKAFGDYKIAAANAVKGLTSTINTYSSTVNGFTQKVDSSTKSTFPFASKFDDLYAIIQRVLNKQQYNYSTVAQDGYLIVTTPQITDEQAMINVNGVLTLTDVAKSVGADVFAVQTPMRYIKGETVLPPSVEDYSHQNADRYLELLQDNGFNNILDLRENKEKYNSQDIYYSTDHHWKVETSLQAAEDVVTALNDTFGYELNESVVDPDNYNYELWKYKMKGSWARRTSPLFIDPEDFTLVTPDYETNVTLRQYNADGVLIGERNGSFSETIIFEEGLPTEVYDKNSADLGYYAYLNATYTSWIKNHNADNDKKVVIFGDSSCRGLGSFLSMSFAETLIIDTDPDRYNISLDKTILEYDPDLVIFVSTVELDHTERFNIQRGDVSQ